jgi:hypothetical protein
MGIRKDFLLICSLYTSLVLSGCNTFIADKSAKEKILFDLKSPRETGISFENKLYETDTFNSLFYEYYFNGAGLAIGDVNNDGLSDIFFGSNMEKSRLYLNKGNLKFNDITESSHINTAGKWVTGVSFVDINQDGWLDIYVCVGGNIGGDYTNLLYINNASNGQLTFSEQAEKAGLDDNGYSTQAAFFDYDRDGDLDMYLVTSSMKVPNKNSVRFRTDDGSMINTDRLYRNDGPPPGSDLPRFVNVSKEAGVTWDGFGLGVGISDINLDGWPDVYVANDYISNDLLYINQGDGTFKDELNSYFKHISYSTMGMDIADFNNDGLTDVFTLDMLPEDYFRKRIMAGNMRDYRRYMQEQMRGYSSQYIRNMLQMNNGKIGGNWSFSEIGQLAGVYETDWSWAPLFADFDNDGLKDLFIGNGIPQDLTNMDFAALWQTKMNENPDIPFTILGKILMEDLNKRGNVKKPNVIYRNNGDLTFEDKSIAWGMGMPSYSTGSAFSDLDNDGDLDLVLNNLYDPASIYENTTINKKNGPDSNSHYLRVHLSGSQFNQGGIGTKIRLYCGGEQQYYEHFPIRGFQSMVDPEIHFGLGAVTGIDTLKVQWPDGKEQVVYNIPTDQLLVLRYDDASMTGLKSQVEDFENNLAEAKGEKLFEEVSDQKGIIYYHKEREFIDFRIQPLIPHQFSKEGPGITVGDINSDGLDDFFVGGSTGFFSAIFIQQNFGNFTSYPLPDNPNYEDMGSLLFDADGDGDDDLYVVSGGTGLPPGNAFYSDRLYINDGKGKYTKSEDALPENKVSGSQVTACDIDKDGDLDLFVCGRIKLEDYPFPDRSFLLRNDSKGADNIHFTDITVEANEELEHIGLVASALWTDYDLDGWTDLILVGEWMPVTIFKNDKGHFINMTSSSGLADYTGWWNSLAAADFDKDGDMDYVVGNHGLNTRYKVSQDQPMGIIVADFDNNGLMDPVCSYYVQGKNYPIYHRNIMIDQLPFIQVKYKHYEDYAKATLEDIFGKDLIEKAYKRDSRYFNSAYIENLGKGSFKVHSLPLEAQFAPVFGILANDYNGDGNCDLLLTGNSYSSNVEDGQYDAFIGLFLEGDGQGNFLPKPGRESGFFVDGDAKGMAELTMDDGSSLILAAQNSGKMKVYQVNKSGGEMIRLNRDDVVAMIHYADGGIERKEFYYGCGYLSNSSRVLWIPEGVDSIDITTYSDESRTIKF